VRLPALPAALPAALLALVLTGCGGGDGSRTLTVLAAASLTGTFEQLADRFEDEHPGVAVRLVLDSSATLATQVREGAPADVLATADEATMATVLQEGYAESAPVFATNTMVLVTPAGDPDPVAGLEDLRDPAVDFVTCVESAPCGALALRLLRSGGITAEPRSQDVDVRAVLAKVVADEADAGLVYASDAAAAGEEVRIVEVPGASRQLNRYPVAVLDDADDPELARAWVELVLSEEGQRVLRTAGFGAP
jgi:molybdate transport system substrate-binding protein